MSDATTAHERTRAVLLAMGHTLPEQLVEQIGNTYVSDEDRFVVSLVVGYAEDEDVTTAHQAAAKALSLTRDLGSFDTHWYVYDRQTGELALIEQGEFDPDSDERHPSLRDDSERDPAGDMHEPYPQDRPMDHLDHLPPR